MIVFVRIEERKKQIRIEKKQISHETKQIRIEKKQISPISAVILIMILIMIL